MPGKEESFFRKIAAFPFTLYKILISPLLPSSCLYEPTCSAYFREAVLRFGILKGIFLGGARLLRCNGWFFRGGKDPLPENFSWKDITSPYRSFRIRKIKH